MVQKKLPFTTEELARIAQQYGTPFHIYDEKAIRENVHRLQKAFSWVKGFKEHFAVKATPNPYILKVLAEEGIGADCSSLPELILAEKVGLRGEDIVFTSNDTPAEEYRKAREIGALINLDDITHIDFLAREAGIPEKISFRYNPGSLRQGGNTIIGNPEHAKYGVTRAQIFEGYAALRSLGAQRFGLHTMIISNELDPDYFVETARMMFELAVEIKQKLGVRIETINLGGGIGIPYRPEQEPVNLEYLGDKIREVYEKLIVPNGLDPMRIAMECGRMITGPYGYLVARAIHKKEIYKNYIGLDACMANLMRPGVYGAYHHITVSGKEQAAPEHRYDVTGSLCENNDKFAVDRMLPKIDTGDLVVIHDTGAHGHAMGFNYNGKLRSKELLLKADGSVKLIRRAETMDDYFATIDFANL
ncbi:MAG: Diaminopimelate decarboxylase [Candidatus Dichloromethanomonas elyunquensis]|nr:MAG: Diaminopimelate decarboxylase [Candidatus Dichloromethanomonas elyunquensis]